MEDFLDGERREQLVAFSIPDTKMNPEHVPAEIWQEIFSLVPCSSDILSIMLASKRFHILALRALHRTVVWRTPTDVISSLPMWEDHPGLHLSVQRLNFSVATPLSYSAPSRGGDFLADEDTFDENGHRHNHLTTAAYSDMVARMLSFKRLTSLTFTKLQLGYRHFELIYNLPVLQTLRIESCGVQLGRFLNVFDPLTLPITDLTMRNLRRLYHEFIGDGTMGDNAYALLNLARAPNLHTLTVDASAEVFKFIFGPGDAVAGPQAGVWVVGQLGPGPGHPPPPHLRRLFIKRKHQVGRPQQQPPQQPPAMVAAPHLPPGMHMWHVGNLQGHIHGHAYGVGDFPEAALFSFLQRCPTLTAYSTYHCATQNAQLPTGGATEPAGLCWPRGHPARRRGQRRPIKSLRLTNCTGPEAAAQAERNAARNPGMPNAVGGQREGLPALASVVDLLRDLEGLDVEFAAWDDEIMHAVVGFFPELRTLKITYEIGGPTETALVAMGPELLTRLPHLHTLHLYVRPTLTAAVRSVDYDSDDEVERALRHPLCLFDDTFESFEDELRELVIPWNRYCPALREVQLTAEFKLLRGYEGGRWNLQRIGKGEFA
ncbi:hypothetical protein EVJ58_g6099 [Rhodofomes roseus]|uniref:F-box domain-containing protein n=1 Tax=Rhodofomes roseus TaxID=34475 RepID=A0A4Y9Y8S3_9APHY|nr:hypothetical protein EVJ58_g6099 [Rhodofomes roseus]